MNRYKRREKNAILGRKLTFTYWENDCVIEEISVKSGHMEFVANAATYLENFNEVKLKLNNHKMLLGVVTATGYQNCTSHVTKSAPCDNFLSTSKKILEFLNQTFNCLYRIHHCDYLLLSKYDIRFVDNFDGNGIAKHSNIRALSRTFKSVIYSQKEASHILPPIGLEKILHYRLKSSVNYIH